MRVAEIEVFKFEELSEHSKDNARNWWRNVDSYPWWDDSIKSLEAFASHFGVRIKDYSIGIWGHSFCDTDASNDHFRGLKLKDFDRSFTPTGYCLDADLWECFYDTWKDTGSALKAFQKAIDRGVHSVVKDMEYLDSDEAIDESIISNGYEFYENGSVFH